MHSAVHTHCPSWLPKLVDCVAAINVVVCASAVANCCSLTGVVNILFPYQSWSVIMSLLIIDWVLIGAPHDSATSHGFDRMPDSLQAKVQEPELYELHQRVQQIRKALDQAPNNTTAEQELVQQEAATQ